MASLCVPFLPLACRGARPDGAVETTEGTSMSTQFSDRCVLTVDAAADGLWYVSSDDHRVGGVFSNRKAALHFAHDEGAALPQALVLMHDGGVTVREEFLDHARVAATVQR